MQVEETSIDGLLILKPKVFGDDRGFFLETFNQNVYNALIGEQTFVQDNHSRSTKGVLRGMHYQENNPQGKLVRCVQGEVFDVAVDLREGSPTFGEWEGVVLSEKNKRQFWIPPGFAHGFVVMSDIADFEYKCTTFYDPSSERSLSWNDPDVAIDWGFDIIFDDENFCPLLSEKDRTAKTLKEIFG
ncbi:dTDP-4-dehydrorhamnose 3,5-epimerase [Citrobacter phage Tr1]|nr:dTDP-4-dehydrorhamnose 3,5-epimerase [Citrobacter phage Tr1]